MEASAIRIDDDILEFQQDAVFLNGNVLKNDDFPIAFGDKNNFVAKPDASLKLYHVFAGNAIVVVKSTRNFAKVVWRDQP